MAFQNARNPQHRLLLLTAILFGSYLSIAISLPIVPIYVTATLGLGNGWAGLGVGIAFLATIASRSYAGGLADGRGAKPALQQGLMLYIAGALVSLMSGLAAGTPWLALMILYAGRLFLGFGESLVAVGVIAWGIGIVGPAHSGRVLSLVGAAIYGALAVGGPIGLLLLDRLGFAGTMAISAVLPILGLAAIAPLAAVVAAPGGRARPPFAAVIGRIWVHGLVVCLQGMGFAAIGAFFTLFFRDHGWAFAGLGLTAFGGGFVLVRILFGHLPDRFGGLTVATVSLAVETIGQFLIWGAPSPGFALVGAFFTGLGCSMIFPSMGREVVHLVEPHLRATALGAFAAFQDVAYGLTGPLAGVLADRLGYGSVFLVGGITAAFGVVVAALLRKRRAVATE